MSGLKQTYTILEVAEILSCNPETVRRAVRKGELTAAKIGRDFRISRIDLNQYWITQGGGQLFEKRIEK